MTTINAATSEDVAGGELLDISPHRHVRDVELLTERGHRDAPRPLHLIEYRLLPLLS